MLPQQYCLRWRYHHSNLQTMFSQLLEREAFCDVTLACEGRTIKAHKIVLSACSTYFETILSQYEEKDPILIMKDVKYVDIKCLVEFMYKGEINVEHCHLATLLKTAEELKIKGLAEVSWRDEEQSGNGDSSTNGVQTAIPQVQAIMPNSPTPPTKRKRGRPPIDDYEQTFTTPKIMAVSGAPEDGYSNDAMSSSENDLNIWDEDQSPHEGPDNNDEPRVKIKKELSLEDDDQYLIDEQSNNSYSDPNQSGKLPKGGLSTATTSAAAQSSKDIQNSLEDDDQYLIDEQSNNSYSDPNQSGKLPKGGLSTATTSSAAQSFLTPALEKDWPDVVKMNDYLNTGRRQQFWEEPFTKRVMDAIKTKNLEMKVAAELLGVSYGTLYGRYRDSYGCLKHPYRVRDFWTEQGPTDVLLKLKRKEITLFRAAEQLNVTPQTLSNYLISMSQIDTTDANSSRQSNAGESYDGSEEETDSILPDNPANNVNVFQNLVTAVSPGPTPSGNSSLANCPDISIVKREKPESTVNNNSDHSETTDQRK